MPGLCPAASSSVPGLSVTDLISLTRFGSRMSGGSGGDDGVLSPDRAHTAVVTQKGTVRNNSREFSLLVFANEDPHKSLNAGVVAQFVSVTNRPGIAQVVWLSRDTLAFLGEGPDAQPQVYTVDLQTRKLVQRTRAALPITMFKAVSGGQTLVYATEPPPTTTSGFATLRAHGFVVPLSVPVSEVVAGKLGAVLSHSSKNRLLHLVQDGNETTISLPDEATYGSSDYLEGPFASIGLSLAPSGDLALLNCRPKTPPVTWAAYHESQIRKFEEEGEQLTWWIVLDMRTGATWPLTGGAAVTFPALPVWTADSRSVIVVNDLSPLDGVSDAIRAARTIQRYTFEMDVRTRATTLITSNDRLVFKYWDPTTGILTLQTSSSRSAATPPQVSYRKTHTGWHELKSTARAAPHTTFEVQQGLNESWTLVAVRPTETRNVVAYDPNKDFLATRRVARETLLTWRAKSGAALVAGLYWPLNYEKGKRYPLLIQTHGFEEARPGEEKFAPEGYSTTGYAAQPLAAAGVMVIQADRCLEDCDTPQRKALSEGQKIEEEWESLIDRLAELELIDRNMIGLQGYSYSCYQQLYFLTHSSYSIAGMTCADGVDGSYVQYMLYAPYNPTLETEYIQMNGGAPFGPSLKTWLERAPGFNLDNIHTPVRLIGLTDGSSLLAEWEPYAGLVLQGKPAELFYLPDAAHNIERPWERIASQQGTVDWFRFWLQDYERTEPITDAEETAQQLAAQYVRWHKLRELQQADLAKVQAKGSATNP